MGKINCVIGTSQRWDLKIGEFFDRAQLLTRVTTGLHTYRVERVLCTKKRTMIIPPLAHTYIFIPSRPSLRLCNDHRFLYKVRIELCPKVWS